MYFSQRFPLYQIVHLLSTKTVSTKLQQSPYKKVPALILARTLSFDFDMASHFFLYMNFIYAETISYY